MSKQYDIAVVGLGGVGSAALYHLASRGVRVLGIDQFAPPHALGSSHGETRMIRTAYFEHEGYVPLVKRSHELWRELSERAKKTLYRQIGVVEVGFPESELISGCQRAARRHNLKLEECSQKQLAEKYPQFRLNREQVALFEEEAGYLLVEDCVAAYLAEARKADAEVMLYSHVDEWSQHGDGVRLTVGDDIIEAGCVIFTAGVWSGMLLKDLGISLRVTRQPMFWFKTDAALWSEKPCFAYDIPEGFFYGIPALDGKGIKAALHSDGATVADPAKVDRGFSEQSLKPVTQFIQKQLLGVNPTPYRHVVCMYTMSPDKHFIVDRLPDAPVVFAAGLSGHGFKFASVLGEILADLATVGKTDHPVDFLRLSRFQKGTAKAV
jgi:monomeric sarcosine oxidase